MTQEQINKIRAEDGLPPVSQVTGANAIDRSAELQSAWGTPEVAKPTRSIPEKILDFTGGKEIAQGLGQAIANPKINKQIEETQKQQFGIQNNLLKHIKEAKALGKDTSRLENALNLLNEEITSTGAGAEKQLNPNQLTNKEVVGDALQLATTAGGAKVAGAVAGKTTKAVGLGKGLIQGAKVGALSGGALGGLSGVSQGLQDNKSGVDITKEGVGGALIGAGSGAILGAVTGAISGGIKGAKISKDLKKEEHAFDLVSPKQTELVKQQALKEGRVTEQGLLKASKILPSKRDIQLKEAVEDIVSPKKSVLENMDAIGKKVQDINTGVKAYVREKKVPFNTNQLKSQINKGKSDLDLIFASDKNAEKTYDAVSKKFMELVKNKDTSGLLDARQEFDKIPAVKKLLESDKLGENARKEIVSTIRTQANKYVAELLPKGNQFRETLLKENRMLEALENIRDKNTGIIGANKLQTFAKKYPWVNWAIGGAATGIAGGAGIGVGKALIGSTD